MQFNKVQHFDDEGGMMFDMDMAIDVDSASTDKNQSDSSAKKNTPVSINNVDSNNKEGNTTGVLSDVTTVSPQNTKDVGENSDGKQIAKNNFERIGPKNFELLTLLGRGAFGKVVLAKHLGTGNVLALKITTKEFLHSKTAIDCTIEERDALARIEHPFLVKLLAAFQTKSKVYLVMEYIIGGELFSHLNNRAFFLEPEARFYAAEVVLALEYLHKVGIIHRDLKPENVLLDDQGHIRITDFGLAKSTRSSNTKTDNGVLIPDETPCKTICGTDEYMAPEMVCKTISHKLLS